jgi:hypothetical protein
MAGTTAAVSLTLGAALGAGWISSFSKATKDINILGNTLERLNKQKADVGGTPFFNLQSRAQSQREDLANAATELAAKRAKVSGGDKSATTAREVELLESKVQTLGAAFRKTEAEMDKANKRLERQGIDYAKAATGVIALSAKIATLTAAQQSLNRAVGSFRALSTTVTKGFAALTAAAGATLSLARGAGDAGDALARQAWRLGISTAALQEFRFAAGLSGMSAEEFDGSLGHLTRSLGDAAKGTGNAEKALRGLGLDLDALLAMPADARISVLADGMRGMASETERASFANAMFGNSGMKMVNLLSQGADGIRKMREEARQKDFVFSDADAKNAVRFNGALFRVSTVFTGIKNAVGAALFEKLAESFEKFAGIVAANRDSIAASFGNLFGAVAKTIPVFLGGFAKVLSAVGKFPGVIYGAVAAVAAFGMAITGLKLYRFAIDLVGVGRAFAGAIPILLTHTRALIANAAASRALTALGGGVLGYLRGFGAVLGSLGGWVAKIPFIGAAVVKVALLVKGAFIAVGAVVGSMALPVVAAIAAIAGAAYLIYEYWEPISAFFGGVFSSILGYFEPVIATMWEAWESIREAFTALLPAVKLVAAALFTPVVIGVVAVVKGFQFLAWVVSWVFRGIAEGVRMAASWVNALANVFGAVFAAITGDFSGMINGLKKSWNALLDILPEWFRKKTGMNRIKFEIEDKTSKKGDAGAAVIAPDTAGYRAIGIAAPTVATIAGVGNGISFTPPSGPSGRLTAFTPPVLGTATRPPVTQNVSAPVTITINAAAGQSPAEIARAVAVELERRQQRALDNSLMDLAG